MKNINIEFLLKMRKSYLDGDMYEIEYGLDFPYEVELRYKDLLKEDSEMAGLIYAFLLSLPNFNSFFFSNRSYHYRNLQYRC